ncbi:hypothetical protein [Helicobacter pylori]|nr:hypothetical protein [Helicobacter pylori]ACD48167.1 hypothetical protein HPSH_03660 [Helicobacter pylori Shi470]
MPSHVNTIVLHGKSDDEVASLMNMSAIAPFQSTRALFSSKNPV